MLFMERDDINYTWEMSYVKSEQRFIDVREDSNWSCSTVEHSSVLRGNAGFPKGRVICDGPRRNQRTPFDSAAHCALDLPPSLL